MPVTAQQHRISSQSSNKPIHVSKYNRTQPTKSATKPTDISHVKPILNYINTIILVTMVILPLTSCWLVAQPLLPTMGGADEGRGSAQSGVVGYHTRWPSATMAFQITDNSIQDSTILYGYEYNDDDEYEKVGMAKLARPSYRMADQRSEYNYNRSSQVKSDHTMKNGSQRPNLPRGWKIKIPTDGKIGNRTR